MSRQFDDVFMNGDLTDADHIKQLIHPLEELEQGQAFYRGASGEVTNTNEVYEVGFQASDTATPNGYYLTALNPGQPIVFKANVASLANASLQVTLEGGATETHPLQVGNTPVGAGDIQQNQIVVAIYNDEGTGRFDVVSLGGTGGGGGGASVLNDLTDVSNSSAAEDEILQANSSGVYENKSLMDAGISEIGHTHPISDINNLQTELNGKQTQDAALDEISGLTMTKGDIIVHDGSALNKLDSPASANDGFILSANSTTSEGVEWIAPPSGGGGGASSLAQLTDVDSALSPADGDLLQFDSGNGEFITQSVSQVALQGPQGPQGPAGADGQDGAVGATGPQGPAGPPGADGQDGADGAIGPQGPAGAPGADGQDGAQGPAGPTGPQGPAGPNGSIDLLTDVDIVGSPGADEFLKHDGTSFTNVGPADVRTALDVPTNSDLTTGLAGKADTSHTHDAADISSGTLPLTRGGTGGGSAAAARTSLDVPSNADLTSGLSGKADSVHTHDTSDIVSGTMPLARGGTGGTNAASARTSLDVPSNSDLTSGLAGKADTTHTHDASDIVSGVLPVSQGGTGGATAPAARTSLDVPSNADLTSGLAGKADSVHTHDAADIVSGSIPLARGGTGGTDAATARTSLDAPSNTDLTNGLAGKADVSHTHVASDITDFDQAVAGSLAASEWAHFPLLESDIVSTDLSDTDIGLGIRNAGDQLDRNVNNRLVLSEGLYVVSFAIACEIDSGGPLEVGLFEYSGSPTEVAGSVRASYGDQNVHGTVVGDAVISVPASQTREIGLRTGSTVVDGKIIADSGFFRVAKVNGGVASNGQTNALNDLSDVLTNSPQSGDLFGYNGSVFTNQTPASFGFVTDSRQVQTSAPMSGGGDLSTDLTLSMPAADGVGQDGYLSSAKFADFDAKADAAHSHTPASLGLEIGVDVQAFSQNLDQISGLSDSKGDLIASSGSTFTSLGAGIDGQVLIADSQEAVGLRWADSSGGEETGDIKLSFRDLTPEGFARADKRMDRANYPSVSGLVTPGPIASTSGDFSSQTTLTNAGNIHTGDTVFTNGYYIAVGAFGKLYRGESLSGLSVVADLGNDHWQEVATDDNGTVVAIQESSNIAVSNDYGASWSGFSYGFSKTPKAICFDEKHGNFVIVTTQGGIYHSSTGLSGSWTSVTPLFSGTYYNVSYGNGILMAFGQSGHIARSVDGGVNWSSISSGTSQQIFSGAYTNGRWLAGGDFWTGFSSDNGLTWTAANLANGDNIYHIAALGGVHVLAGEISGAERCYYIRTDQTTKTDLSHPTGNDGIHSVYANHEKGSFVRCDRDGTELRVYEWKITDFNSLDYIKGTDIANSWVKL